MGVCINYRLGQEKGYLKKNLDEAERVAHAIKDAQASLLGIGMEINRHDDLTLYVDIDGCETLALAFGAFDEIFTSDWSDPHKFAAFDHRGEHYELWPDQKMLWCRGFCKTQYAKNLVAHMWVAEILRACASRCVFADINDEGDYYHTGTLEDAAQAIAGNTAVIATAGGMLAGLGYGVLKGGETIIKPRINKTK